MLPLNEHAWEAVRVYAAGRRGWLFSSGRAAIPASRVSHTVNLHFRYCNIPATCHQLRHWFGTQVYAASKDLRVTQALLGHAHPNTTVGCVAYSVQDARAAVGALAPPAHPLDPKGSAA